MVDQTDDYSINSGKSGDPYTVAWKLYPLLPMINYSHMSGASGEVIEATDLNLMATFGRILKAWTAIWPERSKNTQIQ